MTATLPCPGSSLLSDGDRFVLWMIAEGMTTAEIAHRYRKSWRYAEARVRALLVKTGTSSREHLLETARRCGWLAEDPHTSIRANAAPIAWPPARARQPITPAYMQNPHRDDETKGL